MTIYDDAVEKWKKIVGEEFVLTGSKTAIYLQNITEYHQHYIPVVLKPQHIDEVKSIVLVASQHTIPLYVFSTGKNWGQGSKLPVNEPSVLLDLSRMNYIREINEQYRYVVVEAGVTQIQLFNALKERNIQLALPVSGSGEDTSIVGNMMDRGVVIFAHRNPLLMGIEAVLGTGRIIRTGYWHFFDNKEVSPNFFHAPGVGPDLNGLFTQSNMGIVTAMAIRLIPKRKGIIIHIETKDIYLKSFIDTLYSLREDAITQEGVLFTNKNDPRTTLKGQYVYTGEWIAFTSLNGTPEMMEAAQKEVERRLKPYCHIIEFIPIDQSDETLSHEYFRVLKKMYHGQPTNYSLETMANVAGVSIQNSDYDVDKYKEMPGFSVVLPAVPFVSTKILEVIHTVNLISQQLGMQAFHNFASMGEMSLEGYYRVYFNRNNPEEIAKAHEWNIQVSQALEKIGIFPYRMNIQHTPYFTNRPSDTYWKTVWEIKNVLDPHHIISPGKYCPIKPTRYKQQMNLRIRVLHTPLHQDVAMEYYDAQVEVLKEFGVKAVASIKNKWWENPLAYMFVAEDMDTGEIGAGMRLDVVDSSNPIPIQEALKHISPDIVERVHKFNHVAAEACGLWVKKHFSERNIPLLLIRAALSVAYKLRIKVIVALLPSHTRPLFEKTGFSRVRIGYNAEFMYPDDRYLSTAMEIDPISLKDTSEDEKEIILELRKNPTKSEILEMNGYNTVIQYDLKI
jgi:4-cresol dehydrogenase (hydroxylating)